MELFIDNFVNNKYLSITNSNRKNCVKFEEGGYFFNVRVYAVDPNGDVSLLGISRGYTDPKDPRPEPVEIPDHVDRILILYDEPRGFSLHYYAG